jgi:hypothetical protein
MIEVEVESTISQKEDWVEEAIRSLRDKLGMARRYRWEEKGILTSSLD